MTNTFEKNFFLKETDKMGGQGKNWTPTKRRGPIAAEFQGPGPADITLPSLFGSEFYFHFNCSRLSQLWGSQKLLKFSGLEPSLGFIRGL